MQEEHGINVYDFHARNYMPDIGRTTTLDPLAEKFYSLSPHSFFNNNPVYFIDPDGMSSKDHAHQGDTGGVSSADYDAQLGQNAFNGDSGGGDPCTGCLPQHGHVWNEVVVSAPARKNAGWTTETERYGWSGSNEDYASKYGNMNYDQWNQTYGNDFRNYAAQMDLDEQNRILLEKLTFFKNGFESIAEVIGPGEAINSFIKRTLPKKFNYSSRYNSRESVYRVYGGDSAPNGYSWTPTNPSSVPNFRNSAGLPSGGASGYNNTGRFIIEGTIDKRNIINSRGALPLDGNVGGIREYIINPRHVKINRVSGVNPNF